MLTQLNHWIEIAAVAIDAALLLRILQLKLYRVYLFITLACALGLLFDAATVWLGSESRESMHVFIYSRFLYAFIYPAAVYDVWEEVKGPIAPLRRIATFRLAAVVVLAGVFGLIVAAVPQTDSGEALTATCAVILWAAASTASFAFLWSLNNATRIQNIALPVNTAVWLRFFRLLLGAEILVCLLIIVGAQFNAAVTNSVGVALNVFEVSIMLWCIWNLKALASGVPSPRENAG